MDTGHTHPVCATTPIDYFTYPNHLQMTLDADRLAAMARMHQPAAANSYTHIYPYNSLGSTDYSSQNVPNMSSSSKYCLQSYAGTNAIFGTDVNANPLLSFRDMTYPLLNQ